MRDGDRLPAGSPQRSSPRHLDQGLELAWAPGPRQELVDARAEAEIRDLEAKTAREDRREGAEIAFLKAQTRKFDGEVAQQPQEEIEREARIKEIKARTGESEARTFRIWLMLLMAPLLVATGIIVASVGSGDLASSGYDLLGREAWVLPKLTEGSLR